MRNKHLGTGELGYRPFRKFKVIIAGLRYTVLTDFTVIYKLVISIVVLLLGFFCYGTWLAFDPLIIVVTAMVLMAEIFNTAIEAICDFIEPNLNPRIKIIKDVSAAGVGVANGAWLIVIGWNVIQYVYILTMGLWVYIAGPRL